MSISTTGPETLGGTSDETPLVDPNSKQAKEISGKSPMRIALGRLAKDKIAVVCAAIAFMFLLIAIFAGVIANFFNVSLETPFAVEVLDMLNGGLPKEGPPLHGFDPDHPFGIAPRTGEDNLAHWLYGCRTSMIIAGCATLFASTLGIIVGLVAGFTGGIVDKVLSFITDLFLTIPFLLAALTLAPIVSERFSTSPNYFTIQRWTLIAVLAIFGWMGVARLIRGEVLSLREREFIQAARVLGHAHASHPDQGAAAQPGRPDRRLGLPDAPRVHRARGRPGVPRHRRHVRRVVGPHHRPGRAVLRQLSALPVRADDRDHVAGPLAQPPRRRDPRRVGPQDPALAQRRTRRRLSSPDYRREPKWIRKAGQMRRSKPLAAVATVAALFALAACGGGSDDDGDNGGSGTDREFTGTGAGTKDPEAQGPAPEVEGASEGGTITVYLPQDPGPDTLDPTGGWSVTGNSIQQGLTHRSLTQFMRNEDGDAILVPDLATDLGTPNDDFTEWTFTIRDDATWETGDPVTAEEVAFGITRSLDATEFPSGPGTEYSAHYFLDGDKYKGPYTDKGKPYDACHLRRRREHRDHQDVHALPGHGLLGLLHGHGPGAAG